MKKYPFVSVIVTALNEADYISHTIESLLNQDYRNYEILIVDNGSKDGTADIVKQYPAVRLIEIKEHNISKGRNAGIKSAMGEIVAFTDADMTVKKDWLKNLIRHYSDGRITGVGGPTYLYPKETIFQKAISAHPYVGHRHKREKITSTDFSLFSSGNASYRKDVLSAVGGFDENMWVLEDLELNNRVLKSGRILKFTPDAIAYHFPRKNIADYMRQHYNYGFGWAVMHKNDISTLKLKPRSIIPPILVCFFFILPAVAFFLVGNFIFSSEKNKKKVVLWPLASCIYAIRLFTSGAGYIMGLFNSNIRRLGRMSKI